MSTFIKVCSKIVKTLTKWITGAGQVNWTSPLQEPWYTQPEAEVLSHQTQPYLGSAVRHRLQSCLPTEQLNRLTEIKQSQVCKTSLHNTQNVLVLVLATYCLTLTIQILGTVYVEFVFSPHNDHGCILLHQRGIHILRKKQTLERLISINWQIY